MLYNFHTHTYRCGHAVGNEAEYIENAIENGIKELGFSDHVPVRFPNGYVSSYRIQPEMAEDYINTIRRLREEYKNQINIHIGFEMEYFPLYFKDTLDYARDLGAEYLILGQHSIYSEYPNGIYVTTPTYDKTVLSEYVKEVVAGIQTGVFTYLAHPDLCNFIGDKDFYISEMRKICRACKKADVPLEINLLGIRDNRYYPNDVFWRLVGEEGSPVVTGCDAHDPENTCDNLSFKKAMEMVERFHLNFVEMPRLINPNK